MGRLLLVKDAATGAGQPLAGLDRAVPDAVIDHRTDGAVGVARVVIDTGTSPLLSPLVAAAGLAVRARTGLRQRGVAALTAVVLGVLGRLGRSAATAALAAWAVLVRFTRLYLRVHWLSDVLAGWLFGGACLALLVTDRARSGG